MSTMSHDPFPSIVKLQSMVKNFEAFDDLPATLKFHGTVKLHGTHADIVCMRSENSENATKSIQFQSRNRIITPQSDNCGFAKWMTESKRMASVEALVGRLQAIYGQDKDIMIAGEFCGETIQKHVGISELPKFFVIFAVKVDDKWVYHENLNDVGVRIFNIEQFPTFGVTINKMDPLNQPNIDKIMALTLAVEADCPVAKTLGASGIGEGIVWRSLDDPSPSLWFKTKGFQHCATVNVEDEDEKDAVNEKEIRLWAQEHTTENRLNQGLDHLREFNAPLVMKSIATFIKWVVDDTMKEEGGDLGAEAAKCARKQIMQIARAWYIQKLNQI